VPYEKFSAANRLFKGFRYEVVAIGFLRAVENCAGSKRMNRGRQKTIPHVTEKSKMDLFLRKVSSTTIARGSLSQKNRAVIDARMHE